MHHRRSKNHQIGVQIPRNSKCTLFHTNLLTKEGEGGGQGEWVEVRCICKIFFHLTFGCWQLRYEVHVHCRQAKPPRYRWNYNKDQNSQLQVTHQYAWTNAALFFSPIGLWWKLISKCYEHWLRIPKNINYFRSTRYRRFLKKRHFQTGSGRNEDDSCRTGSTNNII